MTKTLSRLWSNLPLRTKGLVVVLIPLATLIVPLLLLLQNAAQRRQAQNWVSHTLRVETQIETVQGDLSRTESAVRGYRLSGARHFLLSYKTHRRALQHNLALLGKLVADNPQQVKRLQRVRSLTLQRLALMEALRNFPLGSQTPAPQMYRLLDRGARLSTLLQAELQKMLNAERRLYDERENHLQNERNKTDYLIAGVATLGLIGGLLSMVLFISGIVQRIQVLEENAKRLANEEPLQPLPHCNDEIGQLGVAMQAASYLLTEHTAALRSSRQRLQTLFDRSLDVICTVDAGGRFVEVSSASQKVWGYTPNELEGRELMDFVHPDDIAKTIQTSQEIIAGHVTKSFENRYIHKDGTVVPMIWSAVWSKSEQMSFCVARDNSERKEAEFALHQAKEEAERANRAKSEFLSRMSHELRTPLNAILGFGQLLEMDRLNPEQKESVEQILKGGRHLLDLINEILDIARIEAGRLALSPEPVSVREVVQDVFDLIQPLADEAGIQLKNRIQATYDHYVWADRQRLKQVLLNLLSNAVKYNRPSGSVSLSCELMTLQAPSPEKYLRVSVTDTGYGIVAEDVPRLFAPFERLNAANSTIEGVGLGLALCQRLMEIMGGNIGVESTPGEGSTFWIELPCSKNIVDEYANSATYKNGTMATMHQNPPQNELQHRILYIEDNLPNLRLIERILAHHPGVELISAMQGSLGLDLAREHTPDLILLDQHLPDIDGDEVLRRLKLNPETRDIPVVVISADATPGQIERLLALGAKYYLTKPLDVKHFISVLDSLQLTEANHEG